MKQGNEGIEKDHEIAAAEGQLSMDAPEIQTITTEIRFYKSRAGEAILEIGNRLNQAKELLNHGDWLPWLEEKVEFSEASARRFMRLAREYSNQSPVTDLGTSKALILLALPAEEREGFVTEKHMVEGQEKRVADMSKRELQKLIKERDVARKDAEEAKGALKELERSADEYKRQLETAQEEAAAAIEKARQEADDLETQLIELRNAPREVAVEKVADEEAVQDAVEAARKDAEEALKAKIAAAEQEKEKAERAKNKAEQDLSALRVAQEEAKASAVQEKKILSEQVQILQKKLAVASSSEIAIFKLYFDQGQTVLNKMTECIEHMEQAGNAEDAEKLKKALSALLSTTLEAIR